jgi:hypothetical protein
VTAETLPRPVDAFGRYYPDEAKRMADVISLHMLAGQMGKWCAIRLSDGGSDGVAYDTRADAIRHQLHESLCCYVPIFADRADPDKAWAALRFARWAYDNGMRIFDHTDPDPVMPIRSESLAALLRTKVRI